MIRHYALLTFRCCRHYLFSDAASAFHFITMFRFDVTLRCRRHAFASIADAACCHAADAATRHYADADIADIVIR